MIAALDNKDPIVNIDVKSTDSFVEDETDEAADPDDPFVEDDEEEEEIVEKEKKEEKKQEVATPTS